jgi:hypothetical protein
VVLLLEDNSEIKYFAHGEEIPRRHFIQLYDLKKLDSIKLETMLQTRMVDVVSSFINEEKIYFITETHQFVHIYDFKFNHIASFGSPENLNQYRIVSNDILMYNGFIFNQKKNKVKILNESNGLFIKEIELTEDKFQMIKINKNLDIIVYNLAKIFIQKYSFNGILVKEYGSIEGGDLVDITENDKILVNDAKNFRLKVLEIR